MEITYEAFETPNGALAETLDRFAAAGGEGCNITLPLKAEAAALAIDRSEAVRLAGAANTLLREDDGWRAENTDGQGLAADLANGGLTLTDRRVAVLGAGGATAGVLGALLQLRPRKLRLFNRTPASAADLAQRHRRLGAVTGHGLDELAIADPFDLVINATSLGHQGRLPPLTRSLFAAGGVCYDLNYGPAATPLAAWCADHHIPYRDGLGMLVEQAAASFRLWTAQSPDTAPVLDALREEITNH